MAFGLNAPFMTLARYMHSYSIKNLKCKSYICSQGIMEMKYYIIYSYSKRFSLGAVSLFTSMNYWYHSVCRSEIRLATKPLLDSKATVTLFWQKTNCFWYSSKTLIVAFIGFNGLSREVLQRCYRVGRWVECKRCHPTYTI